MSLQQSGSVTKSQYGSGIMASDYIQLHYKKWILIESDDYRPVCQSGWPPQCLSGNSDQPVTLSVCLPPGGGGATDHYET